MIGDTANVLKRLKALFPSSWFTGPTTVYDAVLTGFAKLQSDAYARFQFVKANMRIPTTTGYWLDLTAWDYFGSRFKRKPGQSDENFAAAIVTEIFRPRITRAAVVNAVNSVTGTRCKAFEAFNVRDTGAYGYKAGYGVAGAYGGRRRDGEAYLTIIRPATGIASLGGYRALGDSGRDGGAFAYEGGPSRYIFLDGLAAFADIFRMILATKAFGSIVWARFTNKLVAKYPLVLADYDERRIVDDYDNMIFAGFNEIEV